MSGPAFLSVDAVMFLHDSSVREFGGHYGVRGVALLERALHRPVAKFDYEAAGPVSLAAAYAFGIAKNHAFLDGNKRTAWAACVLFLKLNGVEIRVPAAEAVAAMVALADGGMDEGAFGAWLTGWCGR